MSITQFNATYTPDEDRVLFRFNTSESQEYRLWLTRLIVRDVLALGAQASVAVLAKEHPPEQAKAIAEFKQQAKAQNPNFTTFVPATQFPLGADPVLVHKVRFTIERQVTNLEWVLQRGQVLTMHINEDMVGQIRLLLQTVAGRAQWALDAPASIVQEQEIKLANDPLAQVDPGKVIH